MPWIRTIEPDEAQGKLAREYRDAVARAGKVFNVVKLSSLCPDLLHAWIGFYRTLMLAPGALSRRQREMLAVVVSSVNGCHY